MLKRSLLVFVALVIGFQSGVTSAQQQLKIGVYDHRKILASLPSVQKEQKKLESEFEPKEKAISDKQKSLVKLGEEIEKNGPILGAEELQAKRLEYQSKRRELQLLLEDTERVFSVRRNEMVREIQSLVDGEVIKLAKEQSYDLILRSGVVFASPKVDITEEILKRLSNK